MKTLTIRLPDLLVAEIENESRTRRISKSAVMRERLNQRHTGVPSEQSMRDLAGDLICSVPGLRADLSSNKKKYLSALIPARKYHRR